MRDFLVREARVGRGDGPEVEDALHVWEGLLRGSEVVEVVDENGLYDVRVGSCDAVIWDLLWGL